MSDKKGGCCFFLCQIPHSSFAAVTWLLPEWPGSAPAQLEFNSSQHPTILLDGKQADCSLLLLCFGGSYSPPLVTLSRKTPGSCQPVNVITMAANLKTQESSLLSRLDQSCNWAHPQLQECWSCLNSVFLHGLCLLGLIPKHWDSFLPQNLKRKHLIFFCTTAWPSY